MSNASPLPDDNMLSSLLDVARSNNSDLNITGLLAYHDGNYFQVLEGERQAVLGLYEKIEKDKRHRGALVVQSGEVTERTFSDWRMAFLAFDNMSSAQQDSFLDILSLRDHMNNSGKQVDTTLRIHLQTFLRSLRDLEIS
jgi:hypothetical protein